MVRKENWTMLLSDYLTEKRAEPFQWGSNDCLMFAAKGIEALTGENIYAEYEGYSDEIGAKEITEAHGGVEGIIRKHLGAGSRDVLKAKRGDVLICKMPQIVAGLLDDSGQYVVMVSPEGLRRIPLKMAWRYWTY